MKSAVIALVLAGCQPDCKTDADCIGGDVCAADHSCSAPSELVSARVEWTIGGAPASAMTCGNDQLRVGFVSGFGRNVHELVFAPVPCAEGVFTIDRLPAFLTVELGVDTGDDFAHAEYADANGGNPVKFDLQL